MVVVAVGVLDGPLVLNDLTVRPTSSTVRTLAEQIGYGLLGGLAAGALAAAVVIIAGGRHLIDGRRGQEPSCAGEPASARAPDAGIGVAGQLTAGHPRVGTGASSKLSTPSAEPYAPVSA